MSDAFLNDPKFKPIQQLGVYMNKQFTNTRRKNAPNINRAETQNALPNSTRKTSITRTIIFVFCFLLIAGGVTALASTESGKRMLGLSPMMKVSLTGTVERDKKLHKVGNKEVVNPGEVIKWNLSSVNEGNADATGFRTSAKIPAGTSFVAGTATGDASPAVSYSIDGGNNYAAQPMIEERQNDGSVKQVAAPVSMYSNIQFQWDGSLSAGNKVEAVYQVSVK
jgi:uncharacterized repeat protein (TIGR01451 family)